MTDYDNMIAVFDEAINSDDPRVRQALNSLVMLVQLTRDTDNPARRGPLAIMRQELDDVRQELNRMEKRWDLINPGVTYDWAKIYKHGMSNKIRGTSVQHVWVDELADSLEENK